MVPKVLGYSLRKNKTVQFSPKEAVTVTTLNDMKVNLDLGANTVFLSNKYEAAKFSWFETPKKIEFKNLVVFLTLNCNMHCNYCYVGAPRKIDNNVKFIEDFFKVTSPYATSDPKVLLFGGEPTLRMDLVKRSSELAKTYFISPRLAMTSNGILSEEIRNTLFNTLDTFSISYAGTKKLQMTERPSNIPNYVKKVEDSITYFSNKMPDSFDVKITLTENKLQLIDDIVENLTRIGVKRVVLNPILSLGKGTACAFSGENKMTDINKFIEFTEKLEAVGIDATGRLSDFLQMDKFHLGCGAGYTGATLLPDGMISACYLWLGKEIPHIYPETKFFQIGDVAQKKELYLDKINDLMNFHKKNGNKCKTCPTYSSCNSCLLYWREKAEGVFEMNDPMCSDIQNLHRALYQHFAKKLLVENEA